MDLSPEGLGGYTALVDVLVAGGRFQEALETIRHEPNESSRLLSLSFIYYALGRKSEADAAFRELQRRFGGDSIAVAEIHAYRGETDPAFAALEHGVADRDPELLTVKTDRYLIPLHHDPRYAAVLAGLNLPPDPADAVAARR